MLQGILSYFSINLMISINFCHSLMSSNLWLHLHYRFPKPKDEGWFLLLGDLESQDLLALKRLGGLKSSGANNHQLTFTTPFIDSPEVMGHQIGSLTGGYSKRIILTLYIISDAYLGLDQQYDLKLEVINQWLKSNNLF